MKKIFMLLVFILSNNSFACQTEYECQVEKYNKEVEKREKLKQVQTILLSSALLLVVIKINSMEKDENKNFSFSPIITSESKGIEFRYSF